MILELKDIRMSYGGVGQQARSLLEGVDLSVEEGSVTALVGGNGAGKTTLFNIISGFEKAASGSVTFDGKDITGLPASRIARMGIGRLFQGRQLMAGLTLMENMVIAAEDLASEAPLAALFQRRKIQASEANLQQRAIDLLTGMFGDGNEYLELLDKKAGELSYGQQRLIALVRLLMKPRDPGLLLLDEPTSGIHPRHTEAFRRIILRMVRDKGLTILMIEHNMAFVRATADRCHYLAGGKIYKSGSTSDILDDPVIRKDYIGL